MEVALSLKSGNYVNASKANYKSSKSLLLVCPECGEPVHYKLRELPYRTPFFSHHKEKPSAKLIKACSLRTEGAVLHRASELVAGTARGQLVDRFQREFCKELYKSLGAHSTRLREFIVTGTFDNLSQRDYTLFVRHIETGAPASEILRKDLSTKQVESLYEGIGDVCHFLLSPYGIWVGNFLYQTAQFIAYTLHPAILDRRLGTRLSTVGSAKVLFVAEAFRLKRASELAAEDSPMLRKRERYVPQIAAALVSYLLCKWRFEGHVSRLMIIGSGDLERFVTPAGQTAGSGRSKTSQTTSPSSDKSRFWEPAPKTAIAVGPELGTDQMTAASADAARSYRPPGTTPAYGLHTSAEFDTMRAGSYGAGGHLTGERPLADRHRVTEEVKRSATVSATGLLSPSQVAPSTWSSGPSMRSPVKCGADVPSPSPPSVPTVTWLRRREIGIGSAPIDPTKEPEPGPKLPVREQADRAEARWRPPYDIRQDLDRVRTLIAYGRSLRPPTRMMQSREDLKAWSSRRNDIEALFLADFVGVVHSAPRFDDELLRWKLQEWLNMARQYSRK